MADNKSYTIGELAQAAEVTTRTIRYYVAEEVLPPPVGNGRASLYTEEHLSRLHLVKILKEEFLPLQEIRALLSGLDYQAVLDLLAERRRAAPPPPPTPNLAKEYLQTLLVPPASTHDTSTLMRHKVESHPSRSSYSGEAHPHRPAAPAPSDHLDTGVARVTAVAPAGPEDQSGPGFWQRIEIVPGVELHVRAETATSPLRSKIEQLVKVARQALRSK
jgi:DNA-binding transcriptional MerR regulator